MDSSGIGAHRPGDLVGFFRVLAFLDVSGIFPTGVSYSSDWGHRSKTGGLGNSTTEFGNERTYAAKTEAFLLHETHSTVRNCNVKSRFATGLGVQLRFKLEGLHTENGRREITQS